MSYIVEQKIKGNIYLYEVVSYWDKNKKKLGNDENLSDRRMQRKRQKPNKKSLG